MRFSPPGSLAKLYYIFPFPVYHAHVIWVRREDSNKADAGQNQWIGAQEESVNHFSLEEKNCNCYLPDRRMNYVVVIGEVAFQSALKDVRPLGPCETFRIIADILLREGTEITDNTGRPRLSIFRLQTKNGRLGRVCKIL